MLTAFCKKVIKGWDAPNSPATRERSGQVVSCMGILLNIILFAGKFIAGTLSASISIKADAYNNLSDAGSSLMSFVGVKLAGRPADKGHPFGHARYEYLFSIVIALLILLLGYELVCSSIESIISPAPITFSILSMCVLAGSILVKLWLYFFYRKVGRHVNSPVIKASSVDSITDVMATSAVLLGMLISPCIGFQLDGYIGLVVAVFIIISAIQLINQALNNLLGSSASAKLVNKIVACVKKYPGALGMHDLIVHDYGPGHCFASMHVEVSASEDIMKSHDMIDNIERELNEDLGIEAVIHMDPIETENERVNKLREFTVQALHNIDPNLSMHDFRMVMGDTHSNCIFDVLVPYNCKLSDEQLKSDIQQALSACDSKICTVVTIDRTFVDYQPRQSV